MVALPNLHIDPTLQAVDKALEEQERKERHRPYLGASGVGHECERKSWLSFRWASPREVSAKGLKAIQDGHREEDVMALRLRMVPGVELWTVQPDNSKRQIGFSDLGGHFRGNLDGVIVGLLQAPVTPHVWENKACNEDKFKKIAKLKDEVGEKQTLQHWDPIYYAQAQLYMHYLDLDRHYLTAVTPGGRDFTSIRTEYDPAFAMVLVAKAERIIFSPRPPAGISENPAWHVCKWCDHYSICHSKGTPERNCRTCAHSTPLPEGGWKCERPGHERDLDEPLQRIGCDAYHLHPDLDPTRK